MSFCYSLRIFDIERNPISQVCLGFDHLLPIVSTGNEKLLLTSLSKVESTLANLSQVNV